MNTKFTQKDQIRNHTHGTKSWIDSAQIDHKQDIQKHQRQIKQNICKRNNDVITDSQQSR